MKWWHLLFWPAGFYLFHRQGLSTSHVSTVYAVCEEDKYCILNSTATKTELPIAILNNSILLSPGSNCVVNFVEILHDCKPRRVDLKFSFTSHATHKLYLKVRNMYKCNYTYIYIIIYYIVIILCIKIASYMHESYYST